MRVISFLILTFIICILLYQLRRYSKVIEINKNLQDSLFILKLNEESKRSYSDYNSILDSILRIQAHPFDDKIKEVHSIRINKHDNILFFQIECRDDSTYQLFYKNISNKAILNNEPSKLIIKEQSQALDKSAWIAFKKNLDSLSIYNCTMLNLGCWDYSLSWEAHIYGKRYGFVSRYGSSKFSNTIEFLLKNVKDRDFQLYSEFEDDLIID